MVSSDKVLQLSAGGCIVSHSFILILIETQYGMNSFAQILQFGGFLNGKYDAFISTLPFALDLFVYYQKNQVNMGKCK